MTGLMLDQDGILIAAPDVGEKGYLDARITVASPGGHSSVPPPHTSIGLLALLISHLEAHPHTPRLTRKSPFYEAIQCLAQHSSTFSPDVVKDIRRAVGGSDKALKRVERALFEHPELGAKLAALLGTTQAVDLIEGGVKVNALPESASAVVNHRISADR